MLDIINGILGTLTLIMLFMIPPLDEPENDSGRKNPEKHRELKYKSEAWRWKRRQEENWKKFLEDDSDEPP